ncbi:hypothetical protein E2562_013046, partial [Oryza meyeriana var. granulata]
MMPHGARWQPRRMKVLTRRRRGILVDTPTASGMGPYGRRRSMARQRERRVARRTHRAT